MTTVRAAKIADVPRMVEMRRRSYEVGRMADWLGPFDAEHFADLWTAIIEDPSAWLLVAELEGELVGMSFGVLTPIWLSRSVRAASEAFMWVEPEHRREGVGGALLSAIEAWAREHGAAFVCMASFPTLGPTAMKRMCLSRGYRKMEIHYLKGL